MNDQIKYYQDKLNYETDSWDLYEGIKNNDNIVVVDARSYEAFLTEHIPGAISLPHRTMNIETTSGLSKNSTYITYCDGIGCNASTKGALNLAKLGFKVKELLGGLDWWKRDGYETKGEKGVSKNKIQCGC